MGHLLNWFHHLWGQLHHLGILAPVSHVWAHIIVSRLVRVWFLIGSRVLSFSAIHKGKVIKDPFIFDGFILKNFKHC